MIAEVLIGILPFPLFNAVCVSVRVNGETMFNARMDNVHDAHVYAGREILACLRNNELSEFTLENGKRRRMSNDAVVACEKLGDEELKSVLALLARNGLKPIQQSVN